MIRKSHWEYRILEKITRDKKEQVVYKLKFRKISWFLATL